MELKQKVASLTQMRGAMIFEFFSPGIPIILKNAGKEDRYTRLDSTIRHGWDHWLTHIRWFRNEAISEDRDRGSAAGAVCTIRRPDKCLYGSGW